MTLQAHSPGAAKEADAGSTDVSEGQDLPTLSRSVNIPTIGPVVVWTAFGVDYVAPPLLSGSEVAFALAIAHSDGLPAQVAGVSAFAHWQQLLGPSCLWPALLGSHR